MCVSATRLGEGSAGWDGSRPDPSGMRPERLTTASLSGWRPVRLRTSAEAERVSPANPGRLVGMLTIPRREPATSDMASQRPQPLSGVAASDRPAARGRMSTNCRRVRKYRVAPRTLRSGSPPSFVPAVGLCTATQRHGPAGTDTATNPPRAHPPGEPGAGAIDWWRRSPWRIVPTFAGAIMTAAAHSVVPGSPGGRRCPNGQGAAAGSPRLRRTRRPKLRAAPANPGARPAGKGSPLPTADQRTRRRSATRTSPAARRA